MTDKTNLLADVKRIHFVGIGGSGMSPLAEILHAKGYTLFILLYHLKQNFSKDIFNKFYRYHFETVTIYPSTLLPDISYSAKLGTVITVSSPSDGT